ncbi:MAG: hypothetical protein JXA28_04970 [Bacteroidetes bacterium]|nr:hypothetical protein [Bacteroidota bacterium]
MRSASHFTTALILFLLCIVGNTSLYAQTVPVGIDSGLRQNPPTLTQVWDELYRDGQSASTAFPVPNDVSPNKSGFLAVLYSLVLPGMGELYAGRFDKGKYPLIAEAGLWLGLIGINSYGDWVEEDARIYAIRHAGIDPTGKDDRYFVNIENYSDLYDYNNQRLIERRLNEVYPDETVWQWNWDSEASRLEYKDQRIFADELHNGVTFFVLGMVANRIWSAIQAGISVKQYNASLTQRLLQLPSMHAQLTSYAGRTDGLRFVFSW